MDKTAQGAAPYDWRGRRGRKAADGGFCRAEAVCNRRKSADF
jgi:hypothetical protein